VEERDQVGLGLVGGEAGRASAYADLVAPLEGVVAHLRPLLDGLVWVSFGQDDLLAMFARARPEGRIRSSARRAEAMPQAGGIACATRVRWSTRRLALGPANGPLLSAAPRPSWASEALFEEPHHLVVRLLGFILGQDANTRHAYALTPCPTRGSD